MTPLTEHQIAAQLASGRYTTSPITAAAGVLVPEWVGAREAKVIFSLSRSHLYSLAPEGKIKSAVLKKRGALRGRRIFSADSIRALLNANTDRVGDKRNQEPGCPPKAPAPASQPDPILAQLEAQNRELRARLAKLRTLEDERDE